MMTSAGYSKRIREGDQTSAGETFRQLHSFDLADGQTVAAGRVDKPGPLK